MATVGIVVHVGYCAHRRIKFMNSEMELLTEFNLPILYTNVDRYKLPLLCTTDTAALQAQPAGVSSILTWGLESIDVVLVCWHVMQSGR